MVTYRLQGVSVPESNASIGSSTTRSQQPILIGVPCDSLHCCLMVTKLGQSRLCVHVPDEQFVVIPSTRQLLAVEWPFQTANFLFVSDVLVSQAIPSSHVSWHDGSVPWTSGNYRSIPWNGADPSEVASLAPDHLAVICIPYLSVSAIGSNGEMLTSIAPSHARYRVVSGEFAQFFDLRSASTPNVDRSVEADSKDVVCSPVHQIEVEVVLEVWCVKDFVRCFNDFARLAPL